MASTPRTENMDPTDYSPEECSENAASEDNTIIVNERLANASEVELTQIKSAEASAPSIKRAASSNANRAAIAAYDGQVPNIAQVPPASLRGLTDQQIQDLTDGLKSLKSAVDAANAPTGKGALYTRTKFWAFVIPSMIALGSLTAIVTLALTKSSNPAAKSTDTEDIPQSLKDLFAARAKEWSGKPLPELCDTIRDFCVAYAQSIPAQLVIVRDLKLLVSDPATQASLEQFALAIAPGLAVEVEGAYIQTLAVPRFPAIYDTIKTKTVSDGSGSSRALTVPEAVVVMELSLGRVYHVINAQTSKP